MEPSRIPSADHATVAAAQAVLEGRGKGSRLARLMPFLGPAFIASIAYMDPGNFATNIQGGAQYGYMLLWVVMGSNLMAMLMQFLSAKLGIATGRNLAELCRDRLPRPAVLVLWVLMEAMAMATDLAEFVGAALGFHLLLGMPLWIAGLIVAPITFLLLSLQRYGFRVLELVITGFVGVVAVCYVAETVLDRPDWGALAYHAVVPRLTDRQSVVLAAAILGATLMPHAVFLHSSLTQGRIHVVETAQRRRLVRFEALDVVLAMVIAGAVNAAMLIMAAAAFHRAGLVGLGSLEEAHRTLEPLLGRAASWVFAISLLAAGLSSTVVGTMAGQVMMQGFVRFRIPLWLRRAVTILPSLAIIFSGADPTRSLVVSQVILSLALPFAVVPLVIFTSRRAIMGELVNRRLTTVAAAVVAGLVIALNLLLLAYLALGS